MNLTEKNQAFIKSWEKTRTQGQGWFVSKFALTFILGLMTAHLLLNFNAVTSAGISYFLEGPRFIIYILFGFGYGFYKWSKKEKRYISSMENAALPTSL